MINDYNPLFELIVRHYLIIFLLLKRFLIKQTNSIQSAKFANPWHVMTVSYQRTRNIPIRSFIDVLWSFVCKQWEVCP